MCARTIRVCVVCDTQAVDPSLERSDVNLIRVGGLSIALFLTLLPLKQKPSILPLLQLFLAPLIIFIHSN